MNTEIYTKSGSLSAYGYGCGYVTSIRKQDGRMKELYSEGGVYHVRFDFLTLEEKIAINKAGVKRIDWNSHPKKQWKSFDTLSEAKKLFNFVTIDDANNVS